jgi:hypothetical protein
MDNPSVETRPRIDEFLRITISALPAASTSMRNSPGCMSCS